jgi:tellurite resistance protein TerB
VVAIDDILERLLLDKLRAEVSRYQIKDFLKAVMAVCALTASADDQVLLAERCAITSAIKSEPAFHGFDVDKANHVVSGYISALQEQGEAAMTILTEKVRRMAGDFKRSRTPMRIAYLAITADYAIEAREIHEFHRLCGALDLDPHKVLCH